MNHSPTLSNLCIRVVGVGNSLRSDDGVGLHALRELARFPWPAYVELVDAGAGGLDVLHLLDGASHVCLLDAMQLGRPPGTVYGFPREAVRFPEAAARVSMHGIGLATMLALGERLELRPNLFLAGVEPESLAVGERLSPVVRERLPALVALVRRQVRAWCSENEPCPPAATSLPPSYSPDREGSGIHGA